MTKFQMIDIKIKIMSKLIFNKQKMKYKIPVQKIPKTNKILIK